MKAQELLSPLILMRRAEVVYISGADLKVRWEQRLGRPEAEDAPVGSPPRLRRGQRHRNGVILRAFLTTSNI